MTLSRSLRKLLRMPTRQTVSMVGWLLSQRTAHAWRGRRDHYRPTYLTSDTGHPTQIARYFKPINPDYLFPHDNALTVLAVHFLNHRFNLLGSGWLQVGYGMQAPGCLGIRLPADAPMPPDSDGQWLEEIVNGANLSRARDLWRLIEDDYQPIDWQIDFKSGYRWPSNVPTRQIIYGNRPGVDVKVPWELARMQHLPALVWAWMLADQPGHALSPHRRKFPKEFRNQVLDFMASNPPRFGVNWSCAMDVAIRAVNWLVAFDLFRAHGYEFDLPFISALSRGLREHGRHIIENLEWSLTVRANHYLADLTGLLFIAAYLPAEARINIWLHFALREFNQEVSLQFLEDGGNFEASTSYHRLSGEMLLYATALLSALPTERLNRITNARWPRFRPGPEPDLVACDQTTLLAELKSRCRRLAIFTRAATAPDGRVVQIGDNDSGRLLKITPTATAADDWCDQDADHRHLVAAAAGLVDDPQLFWIEPCMELERAMIQSLAGRSPHARSQINDSNATTMAGVSAPPPFPDAFPQFGVYYLKWNPWWMAVRCGPIGQHGNGGHAHDDALSFVLYLHQLPLIIDLGTYLYTPAPELRNRQRSASSHAVANPMPAPADPWLQGSLGLFSMTSDPQAAMIVHQPDRFVGQHHRFGSKPALRELALESRAIVGKDILPDCQSLQVHFPLHPDVRTSMHPSGSGVQLHLQDFHLSLLCPEGKWVVESALYSPAYGRSIPTSVVRLTCPGDRASWKLQLEDSHS